MALLLRSCFLALASAMYFSMVAANAQECAARLMNDAVKCFSDVGVDLKNPAYSVGDVNNNDLFQSISQRPKEFCQVKEQVKQGLACFMLKARNCLPSSLRNVLPSGEAIGQAMDKLCQHENEIDFDCVQTKATALFNCGKQKGQQAVNERGQMEMNELICMAYEVNPQCQIDELRGCGCLTTKVYTDISYDILYPKNCPSFRPRRVKCNRLTKDLAFFEGAPVGGSGNLRFWLPSLFVTFSMAVIMSWLY